MKLYKENISKWWRNFNNIYNNSSLQWIGRTFFYCPQKNSELFKIYVLEEGDRRTLNLSILPIESDVSKCVDFIELINTYAAKNLEM